MSVRIKGLEFKSRIVSDGGPAKGKLFLGVLGIEYSIPYSNGGVQTFDVFAMGFGTRPTADKLVYDYYNRTNLRDEWAYSDGVLPVYIRFQPDLVYPLTLAAQDDTSCGAVYASQWIDLDEPEVTITGSEAVQDDNGAIVYNDVPVTFVVPVSPASIRKVRLSVQDGQMLFLARIR